VHRRPLLLPPDSAWDDGQTGYGVARNSASSSSSLSSSLVFERGPSVFERGPAPPTILYLSTVNNRDDCENTSLQGGSLLRCRHGNFFIVHASRISHFMCNILLVKNCLLVAAPHLFHFNIFFSHLV
jgi:hypothetical protein